MTKQEFAIGEEVQIGLLTATCIENTQGEPCVDCVFDGMCNMGIMAIGACCKEMRTDGKDVFFKLNDD